MRLTFHINYYQLNTQVSKIRKAFANGSSANKKILQSELSKMVQEDV